MDKQKAFLLNEATDNMNTILEDIYGKLSGRPFSEDAWQMYYANTFRDNPGNNCWLISGCLIRGLKRGRKHLNVCTIFLRSLWMMR